MPECSNGPVNSVCSATQPEFLRQAFIILVIDQVASGVSPEIIGGIPVIHSKRIVKVGCIRLRIIGVEEVAVIVRRGRNELREPEIAFNHQTGLGPLICADFFIELNGFKVTHTGVVVVIAVCFKILVIDCCGGGPVVIDQPPDSGTAPHPFGFVNVVCDSACICFLSTAIESRKIVSRAHCGTQYTIDIAGIARTEARQADSDRIAERDIHGAIHLIACAPARSGGKPATDISGEF